MNAVESSIIVRSEDTSCRERIQAIAWINQTSFLPVSLGVGGAYPVDYTGGDKYFSSVDKVIYPDSDQYDEYLERFATLPSDCIKEGL